MILHDVSFYIPTCWGGGALPGQSHLAEPDNDERFSSNDFQSIVYENRRYEAFSSLPTFCLFRFIFP